MKPLQQAFFAVVAFFVVGNSAAPAADIQITQGGVKTASIIDITGPIESGDAARFSAMSQRTESAFVFLRSPGGLVDEGLSIAAEIRQRGFTTIVAPEAECLSICAVIWVSGVSRIMDSTSKIGVHAAYRNQALEDGTSISSESGAANAEISFLLTNIGLSREAIRYFTTAGPNDILPITPAIAQRLDIDTSVIEDGQVRTPEERPTPRRLARQSTTYLGLSGDCASILGLDPTFLQEQGSKSLKLGHELFGGELFASLVPEMSGQINTVKASEALKDWCTRAAMDLQNQGMSVGISGPSYDCAKAETSTERAICGSFELWLEDRALASIYSVLRDVSASEDRNALAQKQRAWIIERDLCGSEVDCISDRYRSWFLDLSSIAAKAN